ncbi:hypothetical protein OAK12_00765, partial [Alphaproteobacteria bacterium]|nr:hypothetical protein [Alphaproteobacteria bacterium]
LILILFTLILNYSYVISLEINDFVYSVPTSYVFIGLILLLIIIFFIQNIYFKIKFNLSKYKSNKALLRKEKGYNAFLNGIIALSNKDYKKANLESKKTSLYLDSNPSLSMLLKSEIYKTENKYDQLNLLYEEMIKNKDTESLALRGLMEQYLRAQDYHHALIYGLKLFNNNPFVEKIYETLVNIIAKTNNWQQLLDLTEKSFSKKIIDKKNYNLNKSIAFFEIAKIKKYSDVIDAINYIKKALALRSNFPPYVKVYLDILIYDKQYNNAKKIFKKFWNAQPHPEFKNIIFTLADNLDLDIFQLTKQIINNFDEDSKILLVESSIASNKWDEARNEIKGLLDTNPKKEVCVLMAKIEKGDSNNIEKFNSWMFRSKDGTEQKTWVCLISNIAQTEWSSLSQDGHFNTLEWKRPHMLNQSNFNQKNIFYENR